MDNVEPNQPPNQKTEIVLSNDKKNTSRVFPIYCICKYKLYDMEFKNFIIEEIISSSWVKKDNFVCSMVYSDKNVLQILFVDNVTKEEHDVFIFASGVLVFWGCSKKLIKDIMLIIDKFGLDKLSHVEKDTFKWTYSNYTQVIDGAIHIMHNRAQAYKLTVSYVVSYGLNLAVFEHMIDYTINSMLYLAEELSQEGIISASRQSISKFIGTLFLRRSEVNLQSDLLDTPDFIWDRDELESLYSSVYEYLDIQVRISTLNKRLDMISGLLDILSDELKHQHNASLETIIIVLIMFEVVLALIR